MRIEQLQAFLAVVETGSFQRAARLCHTTQSTISRQVQALEDAVGIALLFRGNRARPTVGGELFLPRAQRIVQEWKSALQELGELAAGKQPELCVAAIPSACSSYLPPVLAQFCRDWPEVELRVTALGSDRALKVLRDGLVDLAIVMNNRFLTASSEFATHRLYAEPIVVVMAATHPLAQFDAVPWAELAKYPQIAYKDGYGMQRLVQEQFARRGLTMRVALELNAPEAFRGVVSQGDMVALMPQSALRDMPDMPFAPALETRPLPADGDCAAGELGDRARTHGTLTREVAIATTPDRLKIPPIRHFWQLTIDLVAKQPMFPLAGDIPPPNSTWWPVRDGRRGDRAS